MSGSTRWRADRPRAGADTPTPGSHAIREQPKPPITDTPLSSFLRCYLPVRELTACLQASDQRVDIVIQAFLDAAAARTDARTEAVIIGRTGLRPSRARPVPLLATMREPADQSGSRSKDCPAPKRPWAVK